MGARAAIAALGLLVSVAAARADIDVVVDQARILHLPPKVGTIVIGNPAIADVTLQRSGVAVITGKAYGSTNMIILDQKGETISEDQIMVRAPEQSFVTVQRGMARESLACAPLCERVARMGDAQEVFDAANNQASARAGQAISNSTPSAPGGGSGGVK